MILLLILALVSLSTVVLRWVLSFYLRWIRPSTKIVKDYSYLPSVSVMVAVFNESRAIYDTVKSLSESDYPQDKFEIILCNDASTDDTQEWIEKCALDFPNVQFTVNPKNLKKPKSLCNAFKLSRNEIIVYVDSDCVLAPDCLRELVACLKDETIGACGGWIGVRNVNESALTKYQTLLYYLGFGLFKAYENHAGAVTCISGGLFATRREIFERCVPLIHSRNWFGIPVVNSEDRYLTKNILLMGYRTISNLDAKCHTVVPATWDNYIKQQKRWRSGTLSDFFNTIRRLPECVSKLGMYRTFVLLMPGGTSLLYTIGFLFAPFFNPIFFLDLPPFLGYLFFSIILLLIIRKYAPEQMVVNPFELITFGVFWLVSNVFISILALCSLDSTSWHTRGKEA